jgi:hypothetical protein
MIKTYKKSAVSLALLVSLFSSSLDAQSSDELVQSIMKLRAEVESLYTTIDENKEYYKSEMKSLAMQSADNKAQINRKNTEIKVAQLELEKIRVDISETSSNSTDLRPMLLSGAELLKRSIYEGIPFKVEDRIASVDGIFKKLEEGLITQEKALSLLWASYDDNIRLTKEIGIFKQQITLNETNVLAQIAKIGSVMMYFSTPDERYGYVVKKDGKFTYKVSTDEQEIEEITTLFDALNKQIRTGYFTLPNALVLMENK